MAFHAEGAGKDGSSAKHREQKACRVREGRTHSALVFDGDRAVGWCQFGSPDELPRIKHRKAYEAGLTKLPDWRITCFFVDKEYRGKGVASTALAGALAEIGRLGGGIVEAYPEDATDRKVAAAFLYSGTTSMYEAQGFLRERRLGKHHWVLTLAVPAST